MWHEVFQEIAHRHRFKVLGAMVGLVIALLIVRFGFLWAMFIILCVGVGYWIGKGLDEEPESLREIMERLLPPGRHR